MITIFPLDGIGAICPARGLGAAIIMPAVNTEAMNGHLAEISTQASAGAHCLLVCDGVGWHQPGERLIVPDNITLLPLPPYASELNPIENVRDYLRGNKLGSLIWDTNEAMLEACKQAWHFLVNDPERIIAIRTREWACVKGWGFWYDMTRWAAEEFEYAGGKTSATHRRLRQ